MKRFIKNIIRFGVALLGFLIVYDAITTYAFHQKNTRKYAVWNDILHTDINADVLIMGNSRAWCMYSPSILDSILGVNTYNLGIDGSSFERQYARYEIYRHYQQTKPRCIIQNVEYSTLDRTIGYEREQFMPYMMCTYFREQIKAIEPFSMAELYVPMYRYYKNNFYEDYYTYDYVTQKGYHGSTAIWDGKKLKNMEPYMQGVDTFTLRKFKEYIEVTKQDSIQLILVIAPIYTEAWGKVLNIEEIHQMYKDMSEEYGIPLLDYSKCSLSQDTTYFYNATHLNLKGAELFTIQLAHDLDSLNIMQR